MVCLGLKPGAAGWKAQTNPLSLGGILQKHFLTMCPHFVNAIERDVHFRSVQISENPKFCRR